MQNTSWEAPQPIGQPPAKSFPLDTLPPVVRDMVQAVGEFSQVPIDAPGLASLCMLAVCTQKKFEVENHSGYRESTSLYGNFIGVSGMRKSGSFRETIAPGSEWEINENERRAPDIQRYLDDNELLESEIASIKKKKIDRSEKSRQIAKVRAEQDSLKVVKPIRLFCDDVTPEALGTIMADNNERASMFSPEGGVLDAFERYTNKPNIDIVLKGHSGDPVRINRRGREETLNRPALTIFCCSQPRVIEEIMKNKAYRERGLWARYLYVYPESNLGTRLYETKPIPPEVKRAYRELIFNLLDIPLQEKPDIITLSGAAHEAHKKFFEIIESEMDGKLAHIADFAAKLPGAVLRIAGLLHIAEKYNVAHIDPIPGQTMTNAVKLGYYFLSHALKTFSYTGVDKQASDAQYVVKRIAAKPRPIMSRSEIHALCRGRFEKVESLIPVLKNLVSLGYLRDVPAERTASTGRRPNSQYELNPLYFKEVDK